MEACTHLRDAEGYNELVDLSGVDYLGWGGKGVAGYIGTPQGRDLHSPGSQGFERVPDPKPKRFAVVYHLLRISDDPARLRLKAWLDDGEEIDSVVPGVAGGRLVRARGIRPLRVRLPRSPEPRSAS